MTSPQLRPTRKAKEFMRANDQFNVYAGAAHEGGGGTYTLTDERSFNLSLMDCRSLPEGYPKWVHDMPVVEDEKDDPTCAASGAGCSFKYVPRFRVWGCEYCGRDATAEETAELMQANIERMRARD